MTDLEREDGIPESPVVARDHSLATREAKFPQEGRFRKRPVVVEAFRLGFAWPDWWAEAHIANRAVTFNKDGRWRGGPDYAEIQTLEGVMRANHGDWIIKGVAGEIYPCKPDVFAATYEPAQHAIASASADGQGPPSAAQVVQPPRDAENPSPESTIP